MLTVLIATRNGGRTLPGVLEAYGRAQIPAGGFKLVVVDNGSTDDTSALALRFRDSLPLTWIVEPEPGKNAALNRGLSAIDGDLVVVSDDDAFPHPDLLVRLRAAADAHAEISIFGGAVVARWEVPPPDWLRWVPAGPTFTLTPTNLGEGPAGPNNVFGPNMAVRAKVFEEGYRFDPGIGPRAGQYAMGSETEFVRRLMRQGHGAWHVPGAVVEHFVRETQMTRAWVCARAVRYGRGRFRLARADAEPLPSWPGVPRYVIRGMCAQALRMARARVGMDEEQFFLAQWEMHYLWGQAVEARLLRNEARKG
jgi:glycosyltransferase involved in cell wall biosynthesis